MRLILYIFLIICWTFLILAPLNAFAEDKTFTCEPIVAGHPKDGDFYVEDIHDESTPMLDVIPTNQLLLRGEAEHVYFKNNSSREFEVLVPYESIADIKEIRDIHEGLTSWDEILSFENFRTYYLRYIGDNGSESLKRISINEKNTFQADYKFKGYVPCLIIIFIGALPALWKVIPVLLGIVLTGISNLFPFSLF